MVDEQKPKEKEIDLFLRIDNNCTTCNGTGSVPRVPIREDGIQDYVQCTECKGSGLKQRTWSKK